MADVEKTTEPGSARPTADQPLNGPRRPRVVPILLLLAFVAALVLVYLFGLEVLVPAG